MRTSTFSIPQAETQAVDMVVNGIDYSRQWGLVDVPRLTTQPVTIVGAGSVGSFVALNMAKAGFHNITVIDFDIVSPENIANQFYPLSAIGKPKVDALQELILQFTGVEINAFNTKFKAIPITGLLIACTDNMAVRKEMYDAFCANVKDNSNDIQYPCMFIDARMGGKVYKIQAIPSYLHNTYTWHTDEAAESTPCTEKTIIYNVLDIASKVVSIACQYVGGTQDDDDETPKEVVGDSAYFRTHVEYHESGLEEEEDEYESEDNDHDEDEEDEVD